MTRIPDAEASSQNGATHEACGPEALARRKDELEMVLGAAGIGFCSVAPTFELAGADPQFTALFGLPPDAQRLAWLDIIIC